MAWRLLADITTVVIVAISVISGILQTKHNVEVQLITLKFTCSVLTGVQTDTREYGPSTRVVRRLWASSVYFCAPK